MNYLYIDVIAYGGANIRNAIREMVILADRIGISVWCNLNDVRTLARPGDNADRIWEAWEKSLVSPHTIKMASDDTPRSESATPEAKEEG